MTEGLVGRLGGIGASRRRVRLFHAAFARALSLRYGIICARARHTARLRVLANSLNIGWMLLLTRLSPFFLMAERADYALQRTGTLIHERLLETLAGVLIGARNTAAAFPGTRALPRRARLNTSILFCSLAIVFMASSFYGIGLEVIVDGKSLGFVSSQREFETAVESASAKASDILGEPYVLFPNPLYQFSVVNKTLIFDKDETEDLLLSSIPELKRLFVLTVDGVQVAASQTYSDLRDVLDRKLSQYVQIEPDDKVTFFQDVRIEQTLTSTKLEMDAGELSELILSDLRPVTSHLVSAGDTLKSVADRYGISEEKLLSLNPQLISGGDGTAVRTMSADGPYAYAYDDNGDPVPLSDAQSLVSAKALTAGETLVVGDAIPFLSVCVTRQVTYPEAIPYETEYVKDNDMFDGDSRVVSGGVDGEMTVSAELKLLNGVEIGRTVLEASVVSEPVAEVVAQGTRVRYALGNFIRPYGGTLTSGYGNRYLFGRWSFHSGIDLAGPTGDRIVASDGGKVIFAGRQNGYGNLVIIDHQNGYQTAYAHSSKILVSVGQMVAQGEAIAKVGSTGVSTGPHLHFEIRTNGSTINPLKLIGK